MEVTIELFGRMTTMEVSQDVFNALNDSAHKGENLLHEKRCHWDYRELTDYILSHEGRLLYNITPEDYVCQKETLEEINSILESCTESQRQRFLLHAIDRMSYTDVGRLCGCSRASATESIEAVRKKIQKFFSEHPAF